MGGEGLPPCPPNPAPSASKIPNPLNPLKINPAILVHPLPRRAYPPPHDEYRPPQQGTSARGVFRARASFLLVGVRLADADRRKTRPRPPAARAPSSASAGGAGSASNISATRGPIPPPTDQQNPHARRGMIPAGRQRSRPTFSPRRNFLFAPVLTGTSREKRLPCKRPEKE